MEKNYWMFRVKTEKTSLEYLFDKGIITYGWSDFDLGENKEEDWLKIAEQAQSKRAASMAKNFTKINKGDIVVLPYYKNIAVGEITSNSIYKEDLRPQDSSNTYAVNWLCKSYPKTDLLSNLQSSLKYRGTFLNLHKYSDELSGLIDNKFKGLEEAYNNEKQTDSINAIANHISSGKNVNFSPTDFEEFVGHLFEIAYGFAVTMNTQHKEKIDGKDLTAGLDIDDLGLNIQFNIQVKHHEGETGDWAVEQISKSDNTEKNIHNIVVTSAKDFSTKAIAKAKEKNVVLINASTLAKIICENFDSIDDKYKEKLGLFSSIQTIKR